MRFITLLLGLVLGSACAGHAGPRLRVQLVVEPATRTFTCRYTFALPAGDTTSVLRLNLRKSFRVQRVQSGRATAQVRRLYYPFFADTMQQVVVRYPAGRQARTLTLVYAGTLDKERATAQVLEFSGHSNWLPFRPLGEFEVVAYTLEVRVPAGYQVRSTRPPQRTRPGSYEFKGQASAIELTAIIAAQFYQADARAGAAVSVVKAGAALAPTEAAILPKAQDIVAFYNHTIGRQDSIGRFTVLLTGTQQDAFGLLDNATVITYVSPDFDLAQRGDLLILAHEISHKWWGYGSVHDETDWLNEAFATYSSMLYLQARGDTAGYRQNYEKLAPTTANTPPIIGFDRTKYESGMYRRVVYNKGMVVLAALHHRVGTKQLYSILARTAAQRVRTTTAFLDVVGQVAGTATRAWLLARLSE